MPGHKFSVKVYLMLLLSMAVGCGDDPVEPPPAAPDTTAPANVANLAIPSRTDTSATLTWTAPGDDGTNGTATEYDVRFSTAVITDANFSSATQAANVPVPSTGGTGETFTVTGLTANTTYHFALKTADEVPNVSTLSNVANATTRRTPPQFVLQWGSLGTGNGQFGFPVGIAVDGSGNVYVVDTNNNRIQKFDGTGAFLTTWGSPGPGDGQFDSPTGVAVDGSGNVYVTDRNNNRIQKFNGTGTFLMKWGSPGEGDGQFNNPRGVAVDGSGNVYVVDGDIRDRKSSRIQKFNGTGTFLMKWG